MKKAIVCFACAFLIAACTPSEKLVKANNPAEVSQSSKYDERFDPLSLNDDDIIVKPSTEAREDKKKDSGESSPIEESNKLIQSVDGYRVQLLATRRIESATQVKQQAEQQFLQYGHKVYWSFEAPFYKIRIGDVLTRTEAEAIRDLAKSLGYDQAFPVRSKVTPSDGQL